MKKIITLLLIVFCLHVKAQTDTVNLFYPGYTNECCVGNTTPYFCFNDGGNSSDCGNTFSANTQTFMNTVPSGNIVTKVDVYYYTFNCPGTSATGTLNVAPLSTASVLSGSCFCAHDTMGWSITTSSSNVYPCGIPGYNYGAGATETFNVSFSGVVCISKARIVLTYTTAPSGTTPLVNITASQDTICSSNTVTLTVSGASTYTWNTGATNDTIVVSPVNSTTYNVVGTDTAGNCMNSTSQSIYVESINIQATQGFVCGTPTSVTLTASGANTYTWNTGATTNNIVVTPTVTTTYSVAGTGTMVGCTSLSAVKTITIDSNATPVTSFTLTQDTVPHYWDAVAGYPLNVTNASWSWGDGTSSIGLYPSHIYATSGSYNICVTVTVTTGCSATYCESDSVYRLANSNNSVYNTMTYVNVVRPQNHNETTNINQIASKNYKQVSIYPNPNKGIFTIELSGTTKQVLQIFDINGKLVLSQSINGKANVDASMLLEGVYNLSLISPAGILNKRLIIIK